MADELPKRLLTSLARIKKCGGVVLIHHTSEGATDFQLSNGHSVACATVQKLRERGLLISGADGLFENSEQTLHAVMA